MSAGQLGMLFYGMSTVVMGMFLGSILGILAERHQAKRRNR